MDINNSGDAEVKTFRPAVRSVWFLFFGVMLGPAIMFFERDPDGHPAKWIALSLGCLALIVHRLSLKYTLSARSLRVESWWGLKPAEQVSLAALRRVRPTQGFPGRLANYGHLEVESDDPNEPGLSILGRPDYLDLARQIEDLAARARRGDER